MVDSVSLYKQLLRGNPKNEAHTAFMHINNLRNLIQGVENPREDILKFLAEAETSKQEGVIILTPDSVGWLIE